MGWTSSPAFFCASTKTGRDVAEFLSTVPTLPPHPMEDHMLKQTPTNLAYMTSHLPKVPDSNSLDFPTYQQQFRKLYEVFVDDYIGLVQSTDPAVLRHHSRALLHAIHQIFPPVPGPDKTNDPVSYKKLVLEGEGIWDTKKEILGWIFDGMSRTLQLPPNKLEKLHTSIRQILRTGYCDRKSFESLLGKFTHTTMGIPRGSALLPPLFQALSATPKCPRIQIHPRSRQDLALKDLRALFKVMNKTPTKCTQLVPGQPSYIGFSNACKYGAGGCLSGWTSKQATSSCGSGLVKPLILVVTSAHWMNSPTPMVPSSPPMLATRNSQLWLTSVLVTLFISMKPGHQNCAPSPSSHHHRMTSLHLASANRRGTNPMTSPPLHPRALLRRRQRLIQL